MLINDAGLKNDPDTFNYLCGNIYKSSTYINYESHVSPEAMRKYYTILKAIAVEKPIRGLSEACDQNTFIARPNKTSEIAMLKASVFLNDGDKLRIICPHGVTGAIEATEYFDSISCRPPINGTNA